MRIGYAIRDKQDHDWFVTRERVDIAGRNLPIVTWSAFEEEARLFRRLKDAKRMLSVLRQESDHPEAIHIIDPHWKVVI